MIIYQSNTGSFIAQQRARDGVLCISECEDYSDAVACTFNAVEERNSAMRERKFEVVK